MVTMATKGYSTIMTPMYLGKASKVRVTYEMGSVIEIPVFVALILDNM